jgi:beta-lactamase regulating signal transducer with metallopeptidase domain
MLTLLGGYALQLLWQGALVVLAAAVALRLAGPVASPTRYRLALGALALFAAAPLATAARRGGMLAEWGRSTYTGESGVDPRQLVAAHEAPAPMGGPIAGHSAPLVADADGASGSHGDDALSWLGALWLAGVVALLVRLGGDILQVHRIRAAAHPVGSLTRTVRQLEQSMGGPQGVPVLSSDRADIPFACGVLRPAVVVPAGFASELSPDQTRAVLAHELAHVRRHDYGVNLAQRVLEAVFFFHPGVHWLSRVAREEREHCCDELAAAAVGDRRTVAGALLALEEAVGTRSLPLVPTAGGGALLRRVERLLVHVPSVRHGWAVAGVVILLMGGGTMVLATPATSGAIGPVVWTGELRAGERLRVRNISGSIRVVRATGRVGVVRTRLKGDAPPADLTFRDTRGEDGVTVCAIRAGYGRCDAEGYTWTGAPGAMRETIIDLVVELPVGVSVTAATFTGDLELDGIDADAEGRTGTGAIAARIAAAESGPDRTLELHTGSGMVRLVLPAEFGGELESRLPDARTRTSLGPGGNRVRVSTGEGDLVLTRE